MTNREYSAWQMIFHGARRDWTPPYSDAPLTRPRDLRRVGTTEAIEWTTDPRTLALRDDFVRLPRSPKPWRGWRSMQGRPMQAAHPTEKMRVRWFQPAYGRNEVIEIPAPADPPLWVEDMPRPMWSMWLEAIGGGKAPDRHVIISGDYETVEMIGVESATGTPTVAGVGVWSNATGELLQGRPVTAAKRQLTPLLLGRDDINNELRHRLTITVRGDDNDPRHFPWLNDWIALDPRKVPDNLTRDARILADMLITHGAVIGDHGGVTNLSHISGANWAGINWGDWTPRLSDFRKVTSEA